MFIPAMELFVLMVTILSCSCFGKGLELTATPSPVTEGGNLTLTCSMTANLSSKVQFFRGGRNHLDNVELVSGECKNARNQICNQQCSCSSDGKSFTLTIFNVPKSFNREGFNCVVKSRAFEQSNVLNTSVSNVLNISVIYGPDLDTFNIQSEPVYEGQTLKMYCEMKGGNPLANLTWTCVNKPSVKSCNISTQTDAVWELEITSINRSYNGILCTCTATHVTIAQNLNKSSSIIVYYPPTGEVMMSPTGLYKCDTGKLVILKCRVKGGNPLATLDWQCKGLTVIGQNRNNDTTAISNLTLTVNRTYNQQKCLCNAKHKASPNGTFGRKSVRFDILYKPVITLDTSNAKINESASFSRNCTAEGNPTPKVTWYHEIRELKHNGNLYFSEIKRTNSGRYTCSAISRYPKFESSELFKLVVLYGPDVKLTFTNTTENVTNVRLVCTARGVPDQYTYRWKHMFGSTVIRDIFDHVTNIESVSTLTIPKVTYEDMGTYVCEASNGYRGRDGQILQTQQDFLYVKGRPRAIRAQKTYTTNKGTSLDINITYVSFPKALNTSIIRKDSASPPEDELSVTVSTAPVMLPFYNKTVPVDGYIVQLHLSKFQTKHQGHYQLYVWNEFTYYYDFQIIISNKPDRPRDLEIAQITGTSVVISWIPGEDNGNIQTFTLTCQKNNGEFLTNVNLNHTVSSFKVENIEESVEYDVTVYASNAMGTSESITSTFSIRSAETDNLNAATIAGAAGSAAATILIVCIVVILIRRKKKSGPKHTESRSATNVECTAKYNDDDDGLKANILYESAGPYYPEQPGPSTGNQSGDVYAVVNKSKEKTKVAESYLYAEVQKPKKEAPDSTMNAEVQAQEQKVEVVVHTPDNEVTESSVYAEVKKKTSSAAKNEETLTDHDRNGDGTTKQSEGQEEDM